MEFRHHLLAAEMIDPATRELVRLQPRRQTPPHQACQPDGDRRDRLPRGRAIALSIDAGA
jgi:hypothetical protein